MSEINNQETSEKAGYEYAKEFHKSLNKTAGARISFETLYEALVNSLDNFDNGAHNYLNEIEEEEDELRSRIYDALEDAGYEYAKKVYETWKKRYFNDETENSYYYNSYDSEGHPYKDFLVDQLSEEMYHNYCSGDNDDLFSFYDITEFSKEERDLVADDYLYDSIWSGAERFINETYE